MQAVQAGRGLEMVVSVFGGNRECVTTRYMDFQAA
jgi:hypothetical protein